jgi:hypothetical protein
MFSLPSTSGRVVLVVRHCGPFAQCHQQNIVKKEDKSILISLSVKETGKAGDGQQMQLLSDGNDPLIAEFTVTCSTSCPVTQKGK